MFSIMKDYHEKFNSLNKLKLQKNNNNNKKQKQKMLTNVGDIYNELYDIYKNKYNKKIYSLDAENKKKLDYKKLRLTDNDLYSSEEGQKEQEKTKTDMNEIIKHVIEEEIDLNKKIFKKYFNF